MKRLIENYAVIYDHGEGDVLVVIDGEVVGKFNTVKDAKDAGYTDIEVIDRSYRPSHDFEYDEFIVNDQDREIKVSVGHASEVPTSYWSRSSTTNAALLEIFWNRRQEDVWYYYVSGEVDEAKKLALSMHKFIKNYTGNAFIEDFVSHFGDPDQEKFIRE